MDTFSSPPARTLLITDGAITGGNPGVLGGWAFLLRAPNGQELIGHGCLADCTNNEAEMLAVIHGLCQLKRACRLEIVTDSKYVKGGYGDGWVRNWERRDWRTADGKPVKNRELWIEMGQLLEAHDVIWTHVHGHRGHVDNERVDALASLAIGRTSKDILRRALLDTQEARQQFYAGPTHLRVPIPEVIGASA